MLFSYGSGRQQIKSIAISIAMAMQQQDEGHITRWSTSRASHGRNTFGTCFGETGLKVRPDVFRHDNNCEQKKHVLLCKMSPASHFFLFEKGETNNK